MGRSQYSLYLLVLPENVMQCSSDFILWAFGFKQMMHNTFLTVALMAALIGTQQFTLMAE